MPINTLKFNLHLRRKANGTVFRNIARLWQLSSSAKSHQEILDGLHPWNDAISLRFNNTLPYALGFIGIMFCLGLFIHPAHIYAQIVFAMGLGMIFWAWITIEHPKSIENVIEELEHKTIAFKYQLHYASAPLHLGMQSQPALIQARLKQMFPLFDLGTIANDFPRYASCLWQDATGQQHSILLFKYRYVTEMTVTDKNGNTVRVKEIERFLWGAFVFELDQLNGLAISNHRRSFYHPYTQEWKTSDILTNRALNIYGTDTLSLAKQLKPAQVLKLDQFFQHRKGSLLFHPTQHMACYLGTEDLFKLAGNKKKIQDISSLRGHLRTLRLPHLEKLQQDLLELLK